MLSLVYFYCHSILAPTRIIIIIILNIILFIKYFINDYIIIVILPQNNNSDKVELLHNLGSKPIGNPLFCSLYKNT